MRNIHIIAFVALLIGAIIILLLTMEKPDPTAVFAPITGESTNTKSK